MLTVKKGKYHEFVGSNAQRDEYEADGVPMYDRDPFGGDEVLAFDGERWLVDKVSVEPEPKEA